MSGTFNVEGRGGAPYLSRNSLKHLAGVQFPPQGGLRSKFVSAVTIISSMDSGRALVNSCSDAPLPSAAPLGVHGVKLHPTPLAPTCLQLLRKVF